MEPGEDLILLTGDNFVCERRAGRLTVQAWDQRQNLSRRIVGVRSQSRRQLQIVIEKLAGTSGMLLLLDLGSPLNRVWLPRSVRVAFRERFRRMLIRDFPEWAISEHGTSPELRPNLLPVYPRALLTQEQRTADAMACPPDLSATGVLAFGQAWLHYLRLECHRDIEMLCIFVPAAHTAAIGLRFKRLEPSIILYAYSDRDFTAIIDPHCRLVREES